MSILAVEANQSTEINYLYCSLSVVSAFHWGETQQHCLHYLTKALIMAYTKNLTRTVCQVADYSDNLGNEIADQNAAVAALCIGVDVPYLVMKPLTGVLWQKTQDAQTVNKLLIIKLPVGGYMTDKAEPHKCPCEQVIQMTHAYLFSITEPLACDSSLS